MSGRAKSYNKPILKKHINKTPFQLHMLNDSQKEIIRNLVKRNLNRAEEVWKKVGLELGFNESLSLDSMLKAEEAPSNIPGHSLVSDDNPQVSTYIALVADMRNSSGHLLQHISEKTSKVTQLQRVYYETSALLPALAQTIKFRGGAVTEYLGDGVLSLFLIDEDMDDWSKVLYAAHAAAEDCINDTRLIVNDEIYQRYRLPSLDIGVGMSLSKALVTLVGLAEEKQAKAIGECVFRATKLSSGTNEIIVDESIKNVWPKSKGGMLRFSSISKRGVEGWLVR